ncbi:MAG TPA: site-specific integrase [Candidatus Polarisedimenticolia bacterium]|jgi:integrase|nr:site-specific integrase [Candidatus Polarisedimenticolia bacterium]
MALYRPAWRTPDGKQRKSPFWHYDFIYNGQRHKGSTEEKNKPKAREVESQKRQEARSGGLERQVKPIGFSDFADKYLELHGNAKRSAAFFDFTLRILKRHFEPRPLTGITPLDCADFMAKRRTAVKPSTANASLTVLKHMFRMAEEWGYLAEGANPARKLKREKVRNSRDRYASRVEAEALLTKCSEWLRPVVLAALHTGGRRGEILGLSWNAVDFTTGTLRFPDTKNGDARKIPMSSVLAAVLRSMPNRLKGGPVFLCGAHPVTQKMVRTAFEAACRKAGLSDPCETCGGSGKLKAETREKNCGRCNGAGQVPNFRFHDLRHTWATHLAMDGLPLRTLQELGGWRRPEMVQRYAAVSPASKEQAAQALDRIFPVPPQDPHQKQGQQESGSTV